MSLDKFYQLRNNFIVLGLTGKMQAGADKIVKILSQENINEEQTQFLEGFESIYSEVSISETRKIRRITDFFNHKENWRKFEIIDYRSVVLLFILHENYDENNDEFAANICNWIIGLGTYKEFVGPRFGMNKEIAEGSEDFINGKFKEFLNDNLDKGFKKILSEKENIEGSFKESTLNEYLKKHEDEVFFNNHFKSFSKEFFEKLDSFSPYLRHKLVHVASYCLRKYGALKIETIKEGEEKEDGTSLNHIYTIADVINQLIKIHRKKSESKKIANIVIDRLKNSYELVYFREKYAGFYMLSTFREGEDRKSRIQQKYKNHKFLDSKGELLSDDDKLNKNLNLLDVLDQTEYKVNDFKNGQFESFDIENCVQKSDYHFYLSQLTDDDVNYKNVLKKYKEGVKKINQKEIEKTNEYYIYQPLILQVLKLIALVKQPGLISPTYIERTMQIAYNAKLNSGCISRQVGAVVTDAPFSVKGIGWNEVPHGQVPCSQRDIRDFDKKGNEFTPFEKGETEHVYKDGGKFHEKLQTEYEKVKDNLENNLEGRPCAYCFKSFHNTYENKENQVHTRSLHAEENAMLQVAKHGGQPLLGGNLFTTASPCELCAKKAYQLGIKNIFYIDLYPGISRKHILEGGRINPNLYQFQGAIGSSYHKLYEPFMSKKDETILRSKIKPTPSEKTKALQLKKLIAPFIKDKENIKKELDSLKNEEEIFDKIVGLIDKGIQEKG